MSNKEILQKAISKAIDGGWSSSDPMFLTKDCETANEYMHVIDTYCFDCFVTEKLLSLIFNHDFAKALWPDIPDHELACNGCDARYNWWDEKHTEDYGFEPAKFCNQCGFKLELVEHNTVSPWWGHLQQMVIAEDPIAYLGEHLNV